MWLTKKTLVIIVVQAIITLGLFIIFNRGEDLDYLKENGARLQSVGMIDQAIVNYEEYFKNTSDKSEKGKIAYTIGDLANMEKNYHKALNYYYLAAYQYKYQEADAKSNIVGVLERLGKTSAAKYAMDTATSIKDVDSKDEVVALVGKTEIYLSELNDAVDKLPDTLKSRYNTPTGKLEFLQQLVVDKLLLISGERLGIASSEEFKKELSALSDNMIKQRVLQEKIGDFQIDLTDVDSFFKANKESLKKGLVCRVYKQSKEVEDAVSAKSFDKIKKHRITDNGVLLELVSKLPRLSSSTSIPQGEYLVSLESGTITDFTDGIYETYFLYQNQKMGDRYNQIINELMQAEDIRLFNERVK